MSTVSGVPALAGWYDNDDDGAHLLGARCERCGSYYFPPRLSFCRNPACDGEVFEQLPLSSQGQLWSFSEQHYPPPPPWVAPPGDFVPFTVAAVTLEREQLTVLGQVAAGIPCASLVIGMEMCLVEEVLYTDDEGTARLTWKWRPVAAGGGDGNDG